MQTTYNYPTFRAELYDFLDVPGPKVGEKATDFTATTLDGKTVKLSDYFGKTIVLETGSITCPQYVARINPMNELAKEYPDATFLLLYVREAHPGNAIAEHHSLSEKIENATRLTQNEPENRSIIIDNLEGPAHQTYGSLPNLLYIIDADGKIALRSDWNDVDAVRLALKRWQAGEIISHSQYGFKPVAPPVLLRVLKRAGWDAIFDFFIALPKLIWGHIKAESK
jgi:peroxiredoxin